MGVLFSVQYIRSLSVQYIRSLSVQYIRSLSVQYIRSLSVQHIRSLSVQYILSSYHPIIIPKKKGSPHKNFTTIKTISIFFFFQNFDPCSTPNNVTLTLRFTNPWDLCIMDI